MNTPDLNTPEKDNDILKSESVQLKGNVQKQSRGRIIQSDGKKTKGNTRKIKKKVDTDLDQAKKQFDQAKPKYSYIKRQYKKEFKKEFRTITDHKAIEYILNNYKQNEEKDEEKDKKLIRDIVILFLKEKKDSSDDLSTFERYETGYGNETTEYQELRAAAVRNIEKFREYEKKESEKKESEKKKKDETKKPIIPSPPVIKPSTPGRTPSTPVIKPSTPNSNNINTNNTTDLYNTNKNSTNTANISGENLTRRFDVVADNTGLAGQAKELLENNNTKIKQLQEQIQKLQQQIQKLNDQLEQNVNQAKSKDSNLKPRVEKLEQSVDEINTNVEQIPKFIQQGFDAGFKALNEEYKGIIKKLEGKIEALNNVNNQLNERLVRAVEGIQQNTNPANDNSAQEWNQLRQFLRNTMEFLQQENNQRANQDQANIVAVLQANANALSNLMRANEQAAAERLNASQQAAAERLAASQQAAAERLNASQQAAAERQVELQANRAERQVELQANRAERQVELQANRAERQAELQANRQQLNGLFAEANRHNEEQLRMFMNAIRELQQQQQLQPERPPPVNVNQAVQVNVQVINNIPGNVDRRGYQQQPLGIGINGEVPPPQVPPQGPPRQATPPGSPRPAVVPPQPFDIQGLLDAAREAQANLNRVAERQRQEREQALAAAEARMQQFNEQAQQALLQLDLVKRQDEQTERGRIAREMLDNSRQIEANQPESIPTATPRYIEHVDENDKPIVRNLILRNYSYRVIMENEPRNRFILTEFYVDNVYGKPFFHVLAVSVKPPPQAYTIEFLAETGDRGTELYRVQPEPLLLISDTTTQFTPDEIKQQNTTGLNRATINMIRLAEDKKGKYSYIPTVEYNTESITGPITNKCQVIFKRDNLASLYNSLPRFVDEYVRYTS